METIKEHPDREDKNDFGHPLLLEKVLKVLVKYMSVWELKQARLVCQSWRECSTPILQQRSVVRLRGTCHICHSDWQLNDHKAGPHSHGKTISFYRFVNRLQVLPSRDRDQVFFRNFVISNMNLYLMGSVNNEPTKYFHQFVKLFGRRVFELELDEVQMCPTDSICQVMAMFPNLDKLKLTATNVWADPVKRKGRRRVVQVLPQTSNGFLKSIWICKRWLSEHVLPWERILLQCPHLQELRLENVGAAEMDECLTVLVKLRKEAPERLKILRLVVFPEVRMEEELSADALTRIDSCSGPKLGDGMETLTWRIINQVLSVSTVRDLRVHVGYDDHQMEYLQEVFTGINGSLLRLSLNRSPRVFLSERTLTFKWRPHVPVLSKTFKFPHVTHLEIAHNFMDSLDDVSAIFPALESFHLNIVPTEFVSLTRKSYHTYVRTNLLMSMKNLTVASAMNGVKNLVWNLEEARNAHTGKRSVVYKSSAIRHLPALFPNVTVLKVSITRSSDLQVIFDKMHQLEELVLLSNSFHRLGDDDLIGTTGSARLAEGEERRGAERGIRQLTHLRRLCLDNKNSAVTNHSIVEALVYLRNLRFIHIANAKKLTLRGLRLLGACRYLTWVSVSQLKHEFDDDLDAIIVKTLIRTVMLKERLRRKALEKAQNPHPDPPKPPKKSLIPTRVTENGTPAPPPLEDEPPEEESEEDIKNLLEVDLTIERPLPIVVNARSDGPLPENLSLRAMFARSGSRKRTPLDDKAFLNLAQEEAAMKHLEELWREHEEKKRKEKAMAGIKVGGGRYELGPKFYKIGGKRFDIVRTVYKLNGRTYHLVRRVYETESETQTTWKVPKKKEKRADPRSSKESSADAEATEAESGESESEYERSVKDDDEEDDMEEYCDVSVDYEEEEDDSILLQISGASDDPCATDEEDSVEEIYLDDPMYEGDKEFYDSTPPAEEEEEDEEEDDEEDPGMSDHTSEESSRPPTGFNHPPTSFNHPLPPGGFSHPPACFSHPPPGRLNHPHPPPPPPPTVPTINFTDFTDSEATSIDCPPEPPRMKKTEKKLRFVEEETIIETEDDYPSDFFYFRHPNVKSAEFPRPPNIDKIDSRRILSNPEFFSHPLPPSMSKFERSSADNLVRESKTLTILEIRREFMKEVFSEDCEKKDPDEDNEEDDEEEEDDDEDEEDDDMSQNDLTLDDESVDVRPSYVRESAPELWGMDESTTTDTDLTSTRPSRFSPRHVSYESCS